MEFIDILRLQLRGSAIITDTEDGTIIVCPYTDPDADLVSFTVKCEPGVASVGQVQPVGQLPPLTVQVIRQRVEDMAAVWALMLVDPYRKPAR